jgi:predicted urease superfamily metal-dependent hydrolase
MTDTASRQTASHSSGVIARIHAPAKELDLPVCLLHSERERETNWTALAKHATNNLFKSVNVCRGHAVLATKTVVTKCCKMFGDVNIHKSTVSA